eukprot:3355753-Ditylum_brightwellii.AAC.1
MYLVTMVHPPGVSMSVSRISKAIHTFVNFFLMASCQKESCSTECDKQFKQQLKQNLPAVLRHQPSRETNKPNIKSINKKGNVNQQSTSKLSSK